MYKQMSIFWFAILFFIVAIQSARVPYKYNNIQSLDHQQPIIRRTVPIDNLVNKLVALINRHQNLKRNKRDSNDEQQQFGEQMLQAHNDYRSRHCASPLTLDDDLNDSAQRYAEHLVDIDRLEHSGTPDVGENLWMMSNSDEMSNINGHDPTDSWYSEVEYYNYDQGGFSMETGHFTQLVWKNTEKIGAGIAYNSDRTKAYVVAQYSPSGNYEDQYQENVLPPNC